MTLNEMFVLVSCGLAKRFNLATKKGRAACKDAIEAAHFQGRSIDPSFDGWLRTLRNSSGSGDDLGVARLMVMAIDASKGGAK